MTTKTPEQTIEAAIEACERLRDVSMLNKTEYDALSHLIELVRPTEYEGNQIFVNARSTALEAWHDRWTNNGKSPLPHIYEDKIFREGFGAGFDAGVEYTRSAASETERLTAENAALKQEIERLKTSRLCSRCNKEIDKELRKWRQC